VALVALVAGLLCAVRIAIDGCDPQGVASAMRLRVASVADEGNGGAGRVPARTRTVV
jgi:hypothetical protein